MDEITRILQTIVTTKLEMTGNGANGQSMRVVKLVQPLGLRPDLTIYNRRMSQIDEAFKDFEGEVSGIDICRKLNEIEQQEEAQNHQDVNLTHNGFQKNNL